MQAKTNQTSSVLSKGAVMKIGIIGSGLVGMHLSAGLSERGHEVVLGTRDHSKLEGFATQHPGLEIGSYADAARFGELIMLAVSFDGMGSALELAGVENLADKVVVDLSNPLEFSTGKPALSLGWNTSAGESVQNLLPRSQVVKALNACGRNSMLDPRGAIGGEPEMPIAGNESAAKQKVSALLQSLGWTVVDLGDITLSRLIEPLTLIGVLDNFKTGWMKDNQGWKFINLAR
jgi:8-hydroxy-5-deazaflavin:NADPH oxidoreductase